MSKTRAQVIEKVLWLLGKAGGDVSAEDSARVDSNIGPATDLLSALNIITIGDVGSPGPDGGSIEDAVFLPFCDVVADVASPEFGMGGTPGIVAARLAAESTLKTLASPARNLRRLRIDPALQTQRRYYDGRA